MADQTAFDECLQSSTIEYLDFKVLKFARAIKVPAVPLKTTNADILRDEIESEGYL
jgi:hypothetical protein